MSPRGQTVTERVIRAVANGTGTDPLELPPLAATIDPDALNALIRTLSDGEVSFRYAGCAVTVDGSGDVRIENPVPAVE